MVSTRARRTGAAYCTLGLRTRARLQAVAQQGGCGASPRLLSRPPVAGSQAATPPRRVRPLTCVLACFALASWVGAACGGPAPEVDAGRPPTPEVVEAPEPEVESGPPPGVDHTIGERETLWDIARAYGVTIDEIMEANELSRRDVRRLRPGSVLRIPGVDAEQAVQTAADRAAELAAPLPEIEDGAWYRLGEGETLWDVAALYEDVSVDAIMERNELDEDAVRSLRPGHALVVPGVTARDVERATARRESEPSRSTSRGFRHELARGETVWDLARSFGVSVSEIMAANRLSSDEVSGLREGQRIFIPGVEADRGGRMRRRVTAAQRRALAVAARLGLG